MLSETAWRTPERVAASEPLPEAAPREPLDRRSSSTPAATPFAAMAAGEEVRTVVVYE
ncbi:MAG: hypothetical protein ACRDPE_10910 [Solirubrobacterales bacterium]